MEIDVGKALRRYVRAVNKALGTGRPSEQSHYPALKALIEGCGEGINPHIVERGAPANYMIRAYGDHVAVGATSLGRVKAVFW